MKKSVKNKKHVGRPSGYKPEYCKTALELLSDCKTVQDVASACGDHEYSVLQDWAKKHPEFSLALRLGKQKGKSNMLNKGMKACFSNQPFRENTFKWLMAVMYGVRDKQEITQTHSVVVNDQSITEIADRIKNAALTAAKFGST